METNNVLINLCNAMKHIVTDTVKLRSLRKEDLQSLLNANIKIHEDIAAALATGTSAEMNAWVRQQVIPALRTVNYRPVREIYTSYVKALHGKAASLERSRALDAIAQANLAYSKLLSQISANIDQLMEEEAVNIFNVRISHIGALGIVRQSDRLANFSSYLYTLMVRAVAREANGIPKYRLAYLADNLSVVTTSICDILDKKGPYTFLQDVKSMRSKSADVVLGATGSFNFVPTLRNFYMPNFIDTIISALSCLNIFRVAMDAWDDYQLAKYRRNKETKEWLEAHVALLKMDLANKDKTSPEYVKMTQIIQAYDDKIAEYDKAILDFENAD